MKRREERESFEGEGMREGEEGKNSLPIQLVGSIDGMGATQL